MSKQNPIVPTEQWKQGLRDVYAPLLEPLGVNMSEDTGTRNDGALKVYREDIPREALEDNGLFVMNPKDYTQSYGWLVVIDEGMEYARNHHPSEGRATPKASDSKPLTPEERERQQRRKEMQERMEQIRLQQEENRPEEDIDE